MRDCQGTDHNCRFEGENQNDSAERTPQAVSSNGLGLRHIRQAQGRRVAAMLDRGNEEVCLEPSYPEPAGGLQHLLALRVRQNAIAQRFLYESGETFCRGAGNSQNRAQNRVGCSGAARPADCRSRAARFADVGRTWLPILAMRIFLSGKVAQCRMEQVQPARKTTAQAPCPAPVFCRPVKYR